MSGPNNKYREWILETIDSLRSRKARPDLERICRMVRRRHGSDPERTRLELEKLIREQTVLKVSYKGSISYRNAAKVQRKSRKRSEFSAGSSSGGGGAEDAAKPDTPSAHSRTNLEEEAGDSSEEPGAEPPRTGTTPACSPGEEEEEEGASAPSGPGRQFSMASRNLRGHVKPLGLKDILGYLDEEKLTRGKVKVVMEREVARGRLRRTRCGNITLPLRGMLEVEEETPPRSRAPQDKHRANTEENEPMETASKEEKQGGNDKGEDEEEPRSSEERSLPPVAMTSQPGLTMKTAEDAEVQIATEDGTKQEKQDNEEMSELDSPPKSQSPPVRGALLSQCNGARLEERAVSPHQLPMETESQTQHEDVSHTSTDFSGSECKTEVGVSSCMLTPSASPRDSSLSEEQGIGITSGGLMKSEGVSGSPVDWTVSDVVDYITAAGFPEQATSFRTQEIDGKSLLLMQRNDVLTGLSIRLGPALKIYERHIKVLQKTHFEDEDC
ncbi:sterile alpha motif domain-containing protein 1 [Cololabis saira]|uniref:sterile alpha motif domain-containing protein 1 n=1 Tax=Cololabis saira TaxID=129043 RepID=UPI002AD509A5|nr:sterile alpha motif domain-containing protein 1 [Cololabis saira]